LAKEINHPDHSASQITFVTCRAVTPGQGFSRGVALNIESNPDRSRIQKEFTVHAIIDTYPFVQPILILFAVIAAFYIAWVIEFRVKTARVWWFGTLLSCSIGLVIAFYVAPDNHNGSLVSNKETGGKERVFLYPLLPGDFAWTSPEAQSDIKRFTAIFACEALTRKLDGDSAAAEIEKMMVYEIYRDSTDTLYTDGLKTKVNVNAMLSQGYDPREFQSTVCEYAFGKGWLALIP